MKTAVTEAKSPQKSSPNHLGGTKVDNTSKKTIGIRDNGWANHVESFLYGTGFTVNAVISYGNSGSVLR